jgi:hypothetical protein
MNCKTRIEFAMAQFILPTSHGERHRAIANEICYRSALAHKSVNSNRQIKRCDQNFGNDYKSCARATKPASATPHNTTVPGPLFIKRLVQSQSPASKKTLSVNDLGH